jgi:hypothetical protein
VRHKRDLELGFLQIDLLLPLGSMFAIFLFLFISFDGAQSAAVHRERPTSTFVSIEALISVADRDPTAAYPFFSRKDPQEVDF